MLNCCLVVMMVLPDPFRGMRAQGNYGFESINATNADFVICRLEKQFT